MLAGTTFPEEASRPAVTYTHPERRTSLLTVLALQHGSHRPDERTKKPWSGSRDTEPGGVVHRTDAHEQHENRRAGSPGRLRSSSVSVKLALYLRRRRVATLKPLNCHRFAIFLFSATLARSTRTPPCAEPTHAHLKDMWSDLGIALAASDRRRVRPARRTDIERWQRAGLRVDEDFERGISPNARRRRNVAFALVVAAVGFAAWFAVSSARADHARRRRGHDLRPGAPLHAAPPRTGRLSV